MEAPAAGRSLTLLLLCLLPLAGLRAVAAETRAVEVEAEVFGLGRTPEQARHEALQRARDRAVAEVTGIHIAAQQLRLKSETGDGVDDAFSYLVQTSTHGRIVREEVAYETRIVDGVPVYRATLRAEVALEVGSPDPSFLVDLETLPASHSFRDGEPIEMRITASRDGYLTLLNLRDDGTVGLLFPNERAEDNRLAADDTATVPASTHPFRIEAAAADRGAGGTEQILAIVTLDPVPFRLPGIEAGGTELAGESDPTLAALNRWLLQIPVERRAEAIWDYRVIE